MSLVPPGPHGGDARRLAGVLGCDVAEVLDLSASLNPLAPDCGPLLQDAVHDLDRYPDDGAATAALAAAIGVEVERLVLTNGGAEAIALVAQAHPTGWAEEFDFALYRRHLRTLDESGPRWHSDPHNPTGRLLDEDTHHDVRDEAFYLLATGQWTRHTPGATVVGSLTKAWALPGLRIGYVIATDADEAATIRDLRPRWSVNGLVCAALPRLLHLADPVGWRDGIATLRARLVEILRDHGLDPEPSDANYLWIPDAGDLREQLLPRGILLRDGESFGAPGAVRVAVPDTDGLQRLADALDHLTPSPQEAP